MDKTECFLFFALFDCLKKLYFLLIFITSTGLAAQSLSVMAILEAIIKKNTPQECKSTFQIIASIYFFETVRFFFLQSLSQFYQLLPYCRFYAFFTVSVNACFFSSPISRLRYFVLLSASFKQ